jgi:hypothetical protein
MIPLNAGDFTNPILSGPQAASQADFAAAPAEARIKFVGRILVR